MAALQTKYGSYLKKSLFEKTTQNQAYLELILSFVAVIFFGWFALRPTITTIIDLLTEIEDKQTVVAKLDQKIDALVAADTTYKAAEPKLHLLDEALPTEHQVAQFTSQIETIAQEENISLVKFDYQPFPLNKTTIEGVSVNQTRSSRDQQSATDSAAPTWKPLEFELSANGEYSQLRQLIYQFYQLRRIILTDSINFQQESQRLVTSLNLKLTGQVLYF